MGRDVRKGTLRRESHAAYETIVAAGPAAPWLTLVHGLSQDRRVFSGQLAECGARYRLLLVDLPGHGSSAGLPGPYGLAEYAEAVRGALRAAGVTRTHFWGTHTGASIGLLLAAEEPGLCASLVLEGPVLPGHPPPSVTEMLAEVTGLARRQGLAAARTHWLPARVNPEVLRFLGRLDGDRDVMAGAAGTR